VALGVVGQTACAASHLADALHLHNAPLLFIFLVHCAGNDECSTAYTSAAPLYRCATCAKGFYRLAGKCRKCPDNPWILVVSFVVVVLAAAVVGCVPLYGVLHSVSTCAPEHSQILGALVCGYAVQVCVEPEVSERRVLVYWYRLLPSLGYVQQKQREVARAYVYLFDDHRVVRLLC
jgi:hypothetical protein